MLLEGWFRQNGMVDIRSELDRLLALIHSAYAERTARIREV
jgi:hypothetical protein